VNQGKKVGTLAPGKIWSEGNLPTTNQPINQSTNPSIHQSTNPPIHQSINPPIHQSINPSIHQSSNPVPRPKVAPGRSE
jgi:hypothetical protein